MKKQFAVILMLIFSLSIVSCSKQLKSFNKSMDRFSDEMVKSQNERGKPAELHHRSNPLTLPEWNPPARGGQGLCSLAVIDKSNFNEKTMIRIANITAYIDPKENHQKWKKHNKSALRTHFTQVACRYGADGYYLVLYTDTEFKAYAWAYKKHMRGGVE